MPNTLLSKNSHKKAVLFLVIGLGVVIMCFMGCSSSEDEKKKKSQSQETKENTKQNQQIAKDAKKEKRTIVIDPGHGGYDPGKVGVSGALEKDMNLAIAILLQKELTREYTVIMTRKKDESLEERGAPGSKKASDMNHRVSIITEADPILAISIHQNSFPQTTVKGAQVFYYGESEVGKEMGEIMQTTIVEELKDGNHRQAKANSDYYLLRKTSCPFVIVECGFLSCPEEEAMLQTSAYQLKMAKAIKKGIDLCMEWLERNPANPSLQEK